MALDEVVLRAFLQRFQGHRVVVEARQHHQRDAGCRGVGPPYPLESLRIGQSQVEQDDVGPALREVPLGVTHGSHERQLDEVRRTLLGEHFAKQASIAAVVLDQENRLGSVGAHPRWPECGSFTFVSQKSLMLFTTLSNASSWTGLLRKQFA